jgi:zinc/manganese transport system substrate-binding protein
MKTRLLKRLLLLALWLPVLAQAALPVVATSTSTGMLVREIAGSQATLTILGPPDRDLHTLQARPSMIRALRGAQLVVALGADLEVGWLPVAIQQAANPHILPGRPGYFEAAAQVDLLDVGRPTALSETSIPWAIPTSTWIRCAWRR